MRKETFFPCLSAQVKVLEEMLSGCACALLSEQHKKHIVQGQSTGAKEEGQFLCALSLGLYKQGGLILPKL